MIFLSTICEGNAQDYILSLGFEKLGELLEFPLEELIGHMAAWLKREHIHGKAYLMSQPINIWHQSNSSFFPSHYQVKTKKLYYWLSVICNTQCIWKMLTPIHATLMHLLNMRCSPTKISSEQLATIYACKSTMTELFWGQLFNNVYRDYTIALSAHDIYFYHSVSCR